MGVNWEIVSNAGPLQGTETYRARVTGLHGELGWLVLVKSPGGTSLTFVPDKENVWDGNPYNPNAG